MRFIYSRKGSGNKLERADARAGIAFLLPYMAGLAVFLLVPLIRSIMISFMDYNILKTPTFIGLDNYIEILSGDITFNSALKNTLVFCILLAPSSVVLAVVAAALLNNASRGSTILRSVYFLPVLCSEVAFSTIWKWMFDYNYGSINGFLGIFGLHGFNWLGDERLAMFSVVFTKLLNGVGMNIIIALAALQSIPKMYYEAASLDGAGGFKRFIHITIPEMSPTLFLLGMITFIGAFKVFGAIYTMTAGGPAGATTVLVMYLYNTAFKMLQYGKASAIGFAMFAITLAITFIQWSVRKKLVYQEE